MSSGAEKGRPASRGLCGAGSGANVSHDTLSIFVIYQYFAGSPSRSGESWGRAEANPTVALLSSQQSDVRGIQIALLQQFNI
jgi:hypothetical protein